VHLFDLPGNRPDSARGWVCAPHGLLGRSVPTRAQKSVGAIGRMTRGLLRGLRRPVAGDLEFAPARVGPLRLVDMTTLFTTSWMVMGISGPAKHPIS
jgi:hypothetical protein